jgi:acetolactate synthase-1/2/3 large subunit
VLKPRGADVLMRVLRETGVTRLFTVSGNHIMPAFDAALSAGIDLIHARHEAAAVHTADAWSRASGQVGIALVTAGPGHANAVSALYTARMAEAPLVLLSGHAPSNQLGMGAFQEMQQAQMAGPTTKAAWICNGPDAVARDFSRAIRLATLGRPGPVSLSLPADALASSAAQSLPWISPESEPAQAHLEPDVAGAILDHLKRAARPIVIVGPTSMTRQGRKFTEALEAEIGIPVVGMESPRGIADPSLGAFGEMLAQADCVLLVGKRIDFTLRFGSPPAFSSNCTFLQVDPDDDELMRSRRAVGNRLIVSTSGSAIGALQELARHGSTVARSSHAAWHDDVCAAIRYRPAAWDNISPVSGSRLHPLEALRPLQTLLHEHPEAVLISDGGEFGQWAQGCLDAPQRLINGMSGSIGSALPYAIGARCALPTAPIIAIMGDGTFGFHPAEIDTAVRYKCPFVAIIGNDARWNAEYQIQLRDYGKDRLVGCDLLPVRYDLVCSAFGGYGEIVERPGDMAAAVQRAHTSCLPACVNAMIDGVAAPEIVRQ